MLGINIITLIFVTQKLKNRLLLEPIIEHYISLNFNFNISIYSTCYVHNNMLRKSRMRERKGVMMTYKAYFPLFFFFFYLGI
jgi:hypothetical protein